MKLAIKSSFSADFSNFSFLGFSTKMAAKYLIFALFFLLGIGIQHAENAAGKNQTKINLIMPDLCSAFFCNDLDYAANFYRIIPEPEPEEFVLYWIDQIRNSVNNCCSHYVPAGASGRLFYQRVLNSLVAQSNLTKEVEDLKTELDEYKKHGHGPWKILAIIFICITCLFVLAAIGCAVFFFYVCKKY